MVVCIYHLGTYHILNSEIYMFGRKINQEIYEHCQRLPLKKWCAFKQARWPGRPTRPCHPARPVPWLTPPGPSSYHHLLLFPSQLVKPSHRLCVCKNLLNLSKLVTDPAPHESLIPLLILSHTLSHTTRPSHFPTQIPPGFNLSKERGSN